MTRLPLGTTRAIDRLAARAHAFHRFAHHPLCDRYQGELLQLGRRTRICRGCAFAGAGLLGGTVCGLLLPGSLALCALAGGLGLALGVSSLLWRGPKLIVRFGAACAWSLGVTAALLGGVTLRALGAALLLAGCGGLLVYRRRGPDRAPCANCSERAAAPQCSGFARIWRRERAFQRVAQSLIDLSRAR